METLILTLHIIVCVLLILLVLLQSGKEGMGVIFGGGGNSVFGSSGAGGLLSKLTAFMAVLFLFTCLSYTYVTSERTEEKSVILDVQFEEVSPTPENTPVAPTAPVEEKTTEPVVETKDTVTEDAKAEQVETIEPKAEDTKLAE